MEYHNQDIVFEETGYLSKIDQFEQQQEEITQESTDNVSFKNSFTESTEKMPEPVEIKNEEI